MSAAGYGRIKKLCTIFAVVWMVTAAFAAAAYAADENRTVRVAYPIQEGLTGIDENGNYIGYTYEYLEEIAQYTGWNYEFVQAEGDDNESLIDLLNQVEEGSVDLIGGMLYSEDMNSRFDYASYSYGSVESVLQVPYSSETGSLTINSQIMQQMKVAVFGESSRIRSEFEDYCRINMIAPVYVVCGSLEEQIKAVENGEADAFLNTSMNYIKGVRTVARFAPKPFFFITAKGSNTELMEELNSAILNIQLTDPYFGTTLYGKYFDPGAEEFSLSDMEREYIENSGTVTVGVHTNQPPFDYRDEETGAFRGIVVDLLERISGETGLRFELKGAQSEEEMNALAESGQIDMVAGLPYNYSLARQRNLAMTRPYVSYQYIMLMNDKISEEVLDGKRLALISNGTYNGKFVGHVERYDTTEDCIRAVNSGRADYTYAGIYTAQYYMNQPEFGNMKMVPQTYEPARMCFGVVKPGRRELLNILNKAVVTMPMEQMQSIINQNTTQKADITLDYLLRKNPMETILTISLLFLLIIVSLLFVLQQRARANRQISLDLKKHLRVFALMNDYFFEYDYRTGSLMISVPRPEGEGQSKLLEYSANSRVSDQDERERRKAILDIITSRKDGIKEARMVWTDGELHWLRFAMETILDHAGAPAYTIGKINVIDREVQERDNLLAEAQRDSLTQVYNAGTGRKKISELLAAMKPEEKSALLLIDVDHFKEINDNFGHMNGDCALKSVALALKTSFRENDIVGRPGGDEFMVYMANIRNQEELSRKCDALCRKIRDLKLEDMQLTISVGAALIIGGNQYDEAYRLADQLLYKVKETGRNSFMVACLNRDHHSKAE